MVTDEKYKVDIFLGIGGGPEGVVAASALDAYNCHFQGRFIFKEENEILRAKRMGIQDLKTFFEEKDHVLHVVHHVVELPAVVHHEEGAQDGGAARHPRDAMHEAVPAAPDALECLAFHSSHSGR